MRLIFAALLLTLLLASQALPIQASPQKRKVLIIANEFDSKAADVLKAALSELGMKVERSIKPSDGYELYFVLGGPLAKGAGHLSRKLLPREESQALMNVRGYWTFVLSSIDGRDALVISGHTRKETLQAVKSLLDKGIADFVVDREVRIAPPLSEKERRNTTSLHFKWRFPPKVGKDYEFSLDVPLPLIDFLRVKPRMKVVEFNESRETLIFTWYLMVRTPHDDPYISKLVEKLESIAESEGMDEYRKLWFVASFIQSLKYSLANEFSPTGDYPSYPLETLYRGNGDCEDLSILLISLYEQMGYKSALLIMPTHAAAAVYMNPELVRWPRVKADVIDFEGAPVVLVDLLDLQRKLGEGPASLEFELDGASYFYMETTNFFMPGEVPDLSWLTDQIGWYYSDFPLFVVSMEGVPVPLIANYTIATRRIGDGYGVTVIAKVTNVGDRETVPLKLEAQLSPLSQVKVGGNDPHLVRLGEAGDRLTLDRKVELVDVDTLQPGTVKTIVINFYTLISKMGASIALKYQDSDLDFVRIRPFNP
ncbi:MAG: hypothetical protein QI197_00485 [Candidatus Korarchaeota archaeon]|nr:hypothetical protein [Candidatus Korarchaeota archaeon]